MSSDGCIQVDRLSKVFRVYKRPQDRIWQSLFRSRPFSRDVPALTDVSFTIEKGETVGVLGANGAGKSTLLEILSGTQTSTAGVATVHGRVCALLQLGAGFNPEYSGIENIYLMGALLGLERSEVADRLDRIIDFSGVGDLVGEPVKYYSSGMYVRLAFAVAVNMDPDVLIVDEALAVGDEAFQARCYDHLRSLRRDGVTILFVTHAAQLVLELCDRALLLDAGELLMTGPVEPVVAQYQKLIFAPASEYQQLREAIVKRGSQEGRAMETTVAVRPVESIQPDDRLATVTGSGHDDGSTAFDPALLSINPVAYVSRGAVIETVHLARSDGSRVNLLETGSSYHFHITVRFDGDCDHVRFGMLLKTITGLELGGAESGAGRVDGKKGSRWHIDFDFTCHLNEGRYFVNAGVLGHVAAPEDGAPPTGEVFLDRRVNGVQFRVFPAATAATAAVNFEPAFRVERLDP